MGLFFLKYRTGEGARELGGDLSAVQKGTVLVFCCTTEGFSSQEQLAKTSVALPGVACHLLANPMGWTEPRRALQRESCCG